MDFDNVLQEIGEFGRYQQTNYLLICLPVFFAAANSLSYVFTAGIPNYRCLVKECDKLQDPVYDEPWVQNAVPGEVDALGVFTPEQCKKYKVRYQNDSIPGECPADMFGEPEPCDEWVFEKYEWTIVQEWNITCFENQWKLALVGSLHFGGLVVGTALFGILADKYGRKLIFIFCIIFMSITGVLQGIAWDYISFLVFAFLNAVGTSGVYPLAFIIGVEMVGPKMREMSGVVLNYFYAVGQAGVGLLAWASGNWQILQLVLSAPPILFSLYYWAVPESVRWLLAKDENRKAEKIIRKAAKINKKELSEAMLKSFERKDESNESSDDDKKIIPPSSEDQPKLAKKSEMWNTFIQTVKSKTLLVRSFTLLYIWMTNAFVYYGLSLNSTNLNGDKYVNFALVCLVEIPGYTLAWVALNKFGRRWSLSLSLALCAVTCAAGGFVTEGLTWAIITLFLMGKLGITSSFAIIYVYTAEMMPTIIRSGGVGFMSTFARLGAMLAPFVPLLGVYYKPSPLLLFGLVSLFGAFLSLTLPETFRQKLPDTVEEAERIGKRKPSELFEEGSQQ